MPKRLFLVFVLLNCANVMFAQFSIDWEAEKRFGVDLNRNGKIDIPNSYEYVHPEAFYLDIFLTGNGSDLNELLQRPQRFRWTVRDAAGNVLIEEETRAPRLKAALPDFPEDACALSLSAKQKEGLSQLQKQLVDFAALPDLSQNDVVVSNIRHYEALSRALEAIHRVQDGLAMQLSGDLVSQDLRECLYHLGEIVGGTIETDEVLGNIFKHFCIGK